MLFLQLSHKDTTLNPYYIIITGIVINNNLSHIVDNLKSPYTLLLLQKWENLDDF